MKTRPCWYRCRVIIPAGDASGEERLRWIRARLPADRTYVFVPLAALRRGLMSHLRVVPTLAIVVPQLAMTDRQPSTGCTCTT